MRLAAGFVLGVTASLLAICAVGMLAKARSETWLTLPCCSYHLKRDGQNQKNLGIGIEKPVAERWRLVAGVYDNSSNNASLYAGAVYTPWQLGAARMGSLFGIVTGYQSRPIPFGGPVVSIERERVGLNLLFIPASGGVFGLQGKWRFD